MLANSGAGVAAFISVGGTSVRVAARRIIAAVALPAAGVWQSGKSTPVRRVAGKRVFSAALAPASPARSNAPSPKPTTNDASSAVPPIVAADPQANERR